MHPGPSDTDQTTAPRSAGLEYVEVDVSPAKRTFYRDTYRSFGWVEDDSWPQRHAETGTLRFVRDRELGNRPLLAELQSRSERDLSAIATLERSRTSTATWVAWGLGFFGAAYLAGSVFSFDAGLVAQFLILGAVGLIHWGLALPVHARLRRRRTARVAKKVQQHGASISAYRRQAAELLAGSTR